MKMTLNQILTICVLSLSVANPDTSLSQDMRSHAFSQVAVSCPPTQPLVEYLHSPDKSTAIDVLKGAFTPRVIRNDRIEDVIFEVTVSGGPTSVMLEIDGVEQPMYDDGTHGDATAGDATYTLTLPAEQVTGRLTESDVFRPFLGFINLRDGDTVVLRFNVFAEIWTPSIPLVSVSQHSPVIQTSPHLFNIKHKIGASGTGFDPMSLSMEFYRWFDDDYDFIHFVLVPGFRANRYHSSIHNSTLGLGLSEFDNSIAFGSAGRLQGYNVFPIPFFYDGASRGFSHEIGHQWINFLNGTLLDSGIPHWPFSSVASGVMGFSIPGSGAGGTFAKRIDAEGDGFRVTTDSELLFPFFNDMELYLMGLLSSNEVGPILVFNDQSQFPADGLYPASAFTEITVEDVVAVVGARDPTAVSAQTHFKIATILVSDELLAQEEMAFYDYFTQRAEGESPVFVAQGFLKGLGKPFYVATGERATLELSLEGNSTAVEESQGKIVEGFSLGQNYPNPFNPETMIEYSIPSAGPVEIVIFNQFGQKVRTLIKRSMVQAGKHSVRWNGKGDNKIFLPSGNYYYRIRAENFVSTKRAVLLK